METLGTYAAAGDRLGVAVQNVQKRCQVTHRDVNLVAAIKCKKNQVLQEIW